MKERTSEELAGFLHFCRSERRLAPMTCSAYERDVSACLDAFSPLDEKRASIATNYSWLISISLK